MDNNGDAYAAESEAKTYTTATLPRGSTPLSKIKCGGKETCER